MAPAAASGTTQGQSTVDHENSRARKHDHEHSAKRVKIAQACEECRARKVRCDGVQPVCGACRRRRDQDARGNCTYDSQRANQNPPSSEYIARLEDRIRRLEQSERETSPLGAQVSPRKDSTAAQSITVFPTEHHLDTRADTRDGRPEVDLAGFVQHNEAATDHFLPPSIHAAFRNGQAMSHPSLSPEEGIDGMGNIGATENSYGDGSSSVASFMKQVKDAVASRLSLPRQQTNAAPWKDATASWPRQSAAEFFVLPSRSSSDKMMDIYWNEVHVLYPFLYRPRFMQAYHNLWTGEAESGDQHLMYCILNTIFAITCQVYKRFSPEEKTADAEIYFQRATKLLQVNVIASGSLELIQALLLMGQYLQSTELPHRCWMVVGLAIRTAQGLGMHLPRTSANLEGQQDRELARRLWHGCVFMDRMVSMTFGRPMVITRADALSVPFPASINDEHLSPAPGPGHMQPHGEPSIVEFWLQTLKLYLIQEETLSAMYSNDVVDRKSRISPKERLENIDFNSVLRIESSLRDWEAALPHFLKVRNSTTREVTGSVFVRQANILHLRYLQIRILLLRPILSLMLTQEMRVDGTSSSGTGSCLSQEMALLSARECIKSAQAVINLIYEHQTMTDDQAVVEPLPAWWFNTFFVYTAATALIPARVYKYIRGTIPIPSLDEAWQRALSILNRIVPISLTAKRCLAVLQLLNDESAPADSASDTRAILPLGFSGSKFNEAFLQTNAAASAMEILRADPTSYLDHSAALTTFAPLRLLPDQSEMIELPSTALQIQDLTWFDSLPTDLLAIDDAELFNLPQWSQG